MALPSSNHPSSSPITAQRQSPAASDRNTEDLITYCCVCFLPVAAVKTNRADDATGDPLFWLTSCGHIICGSHVFPGSVPRDAAKTMHTCPYCNSGGISLADLGASKVSQELRDYFRPESDLLEDVAGAIKFRMSNAIRIASHYKTLAEKLQYKVNDQKRVLLKVKDELIEGKELKRQKLVMENEITNLRQEISQLRSQLSIAQLSSLDHDEVQSAQRQYQSSAGALQQNSVSPATTAAKIDAKHKRKADDDPAFRAREFRNEMNKRQAMPPPALPRSAHQIEPQYPDSVRREQYNEGQDQNKLQRADRNFEEYSNQFQRSNYSPLQQHMHSNEPIFKGASNQHSGQLAYRGTGQQSSRNGSEHQFIDLTSPGGSSMDPPLLPHPRDNFAQQQQSHNDDQSRVGYMNNTKLTFRSPLRAPIPRPVSSLPVRGVRDGYFTSPTERMGSGYRNTVNKGIAHSHSPLSRLEHLASFPRQGSPRNLYRGGGGRGQEHFTPSTPRAINNGDDGVISPFFANPPVPTKNLGLSVIGNGVRRPASVASFHGRQGSSNHPYEGGLGGEGFFTTKNDRVGDVSAMAEYPNWGMPRSGAGGRGTGPFMGDIGRAIQEPSRSKGGNMFGPQRGGRGGLSNIFSIDAGGTTGTGVTDRPGLRRSVRRD